MPEQSEEQDLSSVLSELQSDASAYFARAKEALSGHPPFNPFNIPRRERPDHYWSALSQAHRDEARQLIGRLVSFAGRLAAIVRNAPLTSEADQLDLMTATKALRAALLLREYQSSGPVVINEEDRILAVRPPEQSEDSPYSPEEAQLRFATEVDKIGAILQLAVSSHGLAQVGDSTGATRIRPSTAFIMMWMDPSQPHLTDVADTVKQVFRTFDIHAVRADDIEHEGLITERILDEIRTAEFCFADLSDSRPNVYYEVGFAHALRRRVILFRNEGTGLHFDLAGYNCPEYTNLRDLREKLSRRLEHMTNRPPRTAQ